MGRVMPFFVSLFKLEVVQRVKKETFEMDEKGKCRKESKRKKTKEDESENCTRWVKTSINGEKMYAEKDIEKKTRHVCPSVCRLHLFSMAYFAFSGLQRRITAPAQPQATDVAVYRPCYSVCDH